MLDLGIWTQWAGRHIELGDIQSASIWLTNPGPEVDADCYVAYRRVDSGEMFFYPFWSTDPSNCALEFRPLPQGARFDEIELAYVCQSALAPGEYEWLAGLFEPGTFQPISEVAFCRFLIFGTPTKRPGKPSDCFSGIAPQGLLQGTPPTIQLWTDKRDYTVGETLHLSLGLENQGFGMPFDLYIAAKLDADPNGTLFFFPTWATDPSFTNISFLPLAQGASLPDLTIMHLELWDGLRAGDYRFLAAFFLTGTFELASDVAEARWTLM